MVKIVLCAVCCAESVTERDDLPREAIITWTSNPSKVSLAISLAESLCS